MTDVIRTAETRVAPAPSFRELAALVGQVFGHRLLEGWAWDVLPRGGCRVTLEWAYHPLIRAWGMPGQYRAAGPLAVARLHRWRAAHRRVRAGNPGIVKA